MITLRPTAFGYILTASGVVTEHDAKRLFATAPEMVDGTMPGFELLCDMRKLRGVRVKAERMLGLAYRFFGQQRYVLLARNLHCCELVPRHRYGNSQDRPLCWW